MKDSSENLHGGGEPAVDQVEEDLLEPADALPPVSLEDLPPKLQEASARAGWKKLMPVQARAIPYLLAGRDLMVQSRTGSGKTGAFVLPLLELIDPRRPDCQALVLVPTRELARQVAAEAGTLAGESVRVTAVYGGVGYGAQLEAFKKGAHLVVGTPGRVLDHLLRRSLDLKRLRSLIFDEADRMMSMGFYPDMKEVQKYLPGKVRTSMFSATFPPYVIGLARDFLSDPGFLSLSRDHVHVTDTEHVYFVAPPMDKDRALIRIIEVENPPSAIIFCNRKSETHYVTVVLRRFGFDADELSADISQNQREKVIKKLRAGELRFLVATDVAARGLDIPELSHVIIYDVPEDPEAYIHRAGRTGRRGSYGEAFTLATQKGETDLVKIAREYGIDMVKRPLPTDEDVQAVAAERLTAMLESKIRHRDKLQKERMKRFIKLGKELAAIEDESGLLAMLLDDFYQETLHGPPPSPKPVTAPKVSPGGRRLGTKGSGRSRGERRNKPSDRRGRR